MLGEPASLGTLFELANCTLDVMRDLVNRPAGQILVPLSSIPLADDNTLDVREGLVTARRNLETIFVYAVTQLAMWLSKPEFDVSMPDQDTEEQQQSMELQRSELGTAPKERRAQRPAVSLAERLRRGMTGEMAADLQSLLNKSKPVIAKSDAVIGSGSVDLTQILSNFLHERIITPA